MMDERLIAALIAGIISMIGMAATLYLNLRWNKNTLRKVRAELQLESQRRAKQKLKVFTMEIEAFRHTLNLIKIRLDATDTKVNWADIREKMKASYGKLISTWIYAEEDIREVDMDKSRAIEIYLHDSVSYLPLQIIHSLAGGSERGVSEQRIMESVDKWIANLELELENLLSIVLK